LNFCFIVKLKWKKYFDFKILWLKFYLFSVTVYIISGVTVFMLLCAAGAGLMYKKRRNRVAPTPPPPVMIDAAGFDAGIIF
jgi:hypothetical protein